MQRFLIRIIFNTILFILFNVSALFAASLSISNSGSGIYSVQGIGMDGVAGIQFDIAYTASKLGTPTVTKGALVGGAMFAANITNNPIKVAIISTTAFSGSGVVATVSFSNSSNTSDTPTITSYSMIDSKGAAITADIKAVDNGNNLITIPGIPFSDNKPEIAVATATPASAAVNSSIPSVLGTVTMPEESKEKSSSKPVTSEPETLTQPAATDTERTEPAPIKPDETATVQPIPEQDKKMETTQTTYSSVLDRFRNYKGEKSPLIFSALFSKPVAEHVFQEPAIAITNGVERVKVTFMLKQDEKTAPNFALTGSKMTNLVNSKDKPGRWIVEALPNKNVLSTTITMISGNEIVEYPLVVVPPANEITDKETDFAMFLKDTGAKSPKRDLNSDGVHDYQDNYIYTAYYLLLQKNKEKPGKTKLKLK